MKKTLRQYAGFAIKDWKKGGNMNRNYSKKSYPEEWQKVKQLVYNSKINNKFKRIIMKDDEFVWDSITTVQLWFAKDKKFSIKKAMDDVIAQYVKQIPLIVAKRLLNGDEKQ
jgi:acyl carrier protein